MISKPQKIYGDIYIILKICELRLMIKLFKNIVEKITFSKSFLPKNFSKIFAFKNLLLIIFDNHLYVSYKKPINAATTYATAKEPVLDFGGKN